MHLWNIKPFFNRDNRHRNYGETLDSLGISEEETVHFTVSSFHDSAPSLIEMFHSDIKPSGPQTQKGLSIFYSTLWAIVSSNC